MSITRIIVAPTQGVSKKRPDVYKVINLETAMPIPDPSILHSLFADGITAKVIERMPTKPKFMEVMYRRDVIDPEQAVIIELCGERGVVVEAAKVSYRHYGRKALGHLYTNMAVFDVFTSEPKITTMKLSGERTPTLHYDLASMNDAELMRVSADRELNLSLPQMKKLAEFQIRDDLPSVTDVYLETFAAFWSDHCFHTLWKSLGLLDKLKDATARIGNPNLLSAFVDNACAWDFYGGLALLFKLETHNSPTQKEPFGGQQTKLGGVIRDIFENGLYGRPIGNIEYTVVGEFVRMRYPVLDGVIPAPVIARETIRAISSYGNPMGIPMLLARMSSHPDYSAKAFALGGSVGITHKEAAQKGVPHVGDLAVLVGGRTGRDGLHGSVVSSGTVSDLTDTGAVTHVQIGNPFTEQLMMRVSEELWRAGCCTARNDFGAAGIVSCFGEMGKGTDSIGGIIINLALVPLKGTGLADWMVALSESQERFGHAIKPEKLAKARAIYAKYGIEATVVGVFTNTGRFQMLYDPGVVPSIDMELSGEVSLDVPYAYFDECPLPVVEVRESEPKKDVVEYPEITLENVASMGLAVVGHFDVCDQSVATTQYDSTVQGITRRGPLYGVHYDIPTHLSVQTPVFGKQWASTVSFGFSPWAFEADPISAAIGSMMAVLATQVVAGVKLSDIVLADNFYTDGQDPVSLWYLQQQVNALADLSVMTGTPFGTGKDSSSGRGKFGGVTVKVPPGVAITALGKALDARRLVGHQWQGVGNKLVALGPRVNRLDGSILSSAFDITGVRMDRFPVDSARSYLEQIGNLARQGIFDSAVPIDRGGMFLRLFEGMEASGFGFSAEVCAELFPESFGAVLVEVSPRRADWLLRKPELHPLVVGTILPEQVLSVRGTDVNFNSLRQVWGSTFERMVYEQNA